MPVYTVIMIKASVINIAKIAIDDLDEIIDIFVFRVSN